MFNTPVIYYRLIGTNISREGLFAKVDGCVYAVGMYVTYSRVRDGSTIVEPMVRFDSSLSPWMLIDQVLPIEKWPKQDFQSQLIPISFVAKYKGSGVWSLESKVFTPPPEDCNGLVYYCKFDGDKAPEECHPHFIQTTETDNNIISMSQFGIAADSSVTEVSQFSNFLSFSKAKAKEIFINQLDG